MGCEEGFGFDFVVDVFANCPSEAHSVVSAGSAADFIEDDEAAVGCVVNDIGCFLHFDHEGALAFCEVV